MTVSKKAKKEKKIVIVIGLLILFLLVLGGVRLMLNYNKVKIEPRVESIKEYQEENKDMKVSAWLRVPGTDIDYPVIKNYDEIVNNEGKGVQYLWNVGILEHLNRINYIIGHNVMNLSTNPLKVEKGHVRFEQLMSFTYLDFAKKNQYVQFTIDGKDYLFKIFAVTYPTAAGVSMYNDDEADDSDVKDEVKMLLKNSIFDYDVDVNEKDTIISLITCTRMFDRERDFQVSARLVREGEKTGKYKVEKSDKYKEVELKMKGGNEQDENTKDNKEA